jgi:hypothetical protein
MVCFYQSGRSLALASAFGGGLSWAANTGNQANFCDWGKASERKILERLLASARFEFRPNSMLCGKTFDEIVARNVPNT